MKGLKSVSMFLENQSDILLNLGFTIFREGEGLEWAAMFGGVTTFEGSITLAVCYFWGVITFRSLRYCN